MSGSGWMAFSLFLWWSFPVSSSNETNEARPAKYVFPQKVSLGAVSQKVSEIDPTSIVAQAEFFSGSLDELDRHVVEEKIFLLDNDSSMSEGSPRKSEMGEPSRDEETELFQKAEEPIGRPPTIPMLEPMKLEMGGRAYLAIQYQFLQGISWSLQPITSPSLLDLYWDARPNDRIRAFISTRLDYDFSVSDLQNQVGIFPRARNRLRLDQLWLKFDLDRTIFLTFGKQRIRWGSGRIWNPTDFLNPQVLNPLDVFDRRLGVTLVKVHLPVEKSGSNLYLFLTLDEANLFTRAGFASRIEVLLLNTEVAGSFAIQKDQPLRFGFDVSSGLGPFDVHSELAFRFGDSRPFWNEIDSESGTEWVQRRRPDAWYTQALVGAETSWVYAEDGFLTIGLEYFWNQLGYPSPELYTFLFTRGAFQPLYLGEQYVAGFLALPGPGQLNNVNLVLTTLANLSDGSLLTRSDGAIRFLSFMTLNTWLVVHYGKLGELQLPIEIPAGELPGLEGGISVPPPRFELGAALNLDF